MFGSSIWRHCLAINDDELDKLLWVIWNWLYDIEIFVKWQDRYSAFRWYLIHEFRRNFLCESMAVLGALEQAWKVDIWRCMIASTCQSFCFGGATESLKVWHMTLYNCKHLSTLPFWGFLEDHMLFEQQQMEHTKDGTTRKGANRKNSRTCSKHKFSPQMEQDSRFAGSSHVWDGEDHEGHEGGDELPWIFVNSFH